MEKEVTVSKPKLTRLPSDSIRHPEQISTTFAKINDV